MNSPRPAERIFCALDTTDPQSARALATALGSVVGGVKLGLEFFGAGGPQAFRHVAEAGLPIFLDLKLHDIPNTVAATIRALMPLRPAIMTLHTAGGPAMMQAARKAADEAAESLNIPRPLLMGVTILTSLDADDLTAVGLGLPIEDQVVRMARLAQDSGLDGVVCSPFEITAIRAACGPDFKLVVPGIRPEGQARGDQKRTMTPAEAYTRGADILVIGRPITEAVDPVAAAETISRTLPPDVPRL